MNKNILIPVLGIAAGGLMWVGATNAHARSEDSIYPRIVQKLAQKFDLNETEVKAVFDEERDSHQKEMQANFESRLTQAVTDGKITESQKQAILTKMQEQKAARETNKESMKDTDLKTRKAEMEAKRTELESWAKEQDIDLSVLKELMHPFGGKGLKMHMRMH